MNSQAWNQRLENQEKLEAEDEKFFIQIFGAK